MLTIDPKLELKLKALAEQEHRSLDEILQRMINHYLAQQPQSDLLIDIVNDLPDVSCFNQQDPLDIQRKLRSEWN